MAQSNTQNVKMGVCRLRYDGKDLGYTKGGVEFSVTTETHKVMIDQFGNSEVDEVIMSRSAKVTAPLAETTLENLVAIMPGATLYSDGVKASGNITFTAAPAAADTVVVNGVTYTFKVAASATGLLDVAIGVVAGGLTAAQNTAKNLLLALQSSSDTRVTAANYSLDPTGLIITVLYGARGVAGNAFAMSKTGTSPTVSALLTGGVAATQERVDIKRGVGTSLLTQAKELVLHPIALADNDYSQDVILPKTAAAGALSFAFKVDQERTFPVEFNAYPDTTNQNILFQIGDKRVTTAASN